MIVRIAGEGQYRIPDSGRERLNEIDNGAVAAADAGEEGRFRELLDQMLSFVRDGGEPVAVDELVQSDVILPPADTTLAEARAEFTGEGLIPG